MRHILFVGCLMCLVLLSSLSCADREDFPLFFIPEATIVLDGMNDDWPTTVPFIMESDPQIRTGGRQNPEDFMVTVRCFFDTRNLYLFASFIDSVPLKNQYVGNDIYRGDSLEVYLGFREEESEVYGPHDFQFGIGISEQGQETWLWTKGHVLSGEETVSVKTNNGYHLEAKIPLSNFGRDSVKAGEPIWFDFGANNDNGGGDRATQLIWFGDGTGWQSPSVWRKGRLTSDSQMMKKAYILTPPEFLTGEFHRIHFWHDGKPWQGKVTLGKEVLTTDENGGVDVVLEQQGIVKISANIIGTSVSKRIEIGSKNEEKIIRLPVNPIKVNQVGYMPDEEKRFVLTVEDTEKLPSMEFSLTKIPGSKVVYTGRLEGYVEDSITGDILYSGDFSDFNTPGKYKIQVEEFGKSYVFSIRENVFERVFLATMRSYYLQRCGMNVRDKKSKVSYEACHLNDGVLKTNPEQTLDVTGGWHDAGDYGKYMPTAGVTVAQLLLLYELMPEKFADFSLKIPESKNDLPDMLDEVKYELDWMLKMQGADGGVFHKVNTMNFPGMIMPDTDTQTRYIYEKGTTDTGIFAGGMAVAARVFESIDPEYAATLKSAAILSGQFLIERLDEPVLWPSNDNTGAYKSDVVDDELFWAFAELYRLTSDDTYLEMVWPLSGQLKGYLAKELPAFGWENTLTLGLFTLLFAGNTPQEIRQEIGTVIRERLGILLMTIQGSGYHMSLSNDDFHWASNKVACARGMNLILAYELFHDEAFKQAARYQLDYILGVNTLSKSFITKIGADSVRYPHHRVVEASGLLVPGLLVGGPNNDAQDGVYKQGLQVRGYVDDQRSYASNEYAIDYNAPLVFLSGYFMKYSNAK